MKSEGLVEMANQTSIAVSAATKVSTYGGSAGAVIFGLAANEMAAIGGLVIGLLGLIVTFYFKWRDDRRATQLHAAQMKRYLAEVHPHD